MAVYFRQAPYDTHQIRLAKAREMYGTLDDGKYRIFRFDGGNTLKVRIFQSEREMKEFLLEYHGWYMLDETHFKKL